MFPQSLATTIQKIKQKPKNEKQFYPTVNYLQQRPLQPLPQTVKRPVFQPLPQTVKRPVVQQVKNKTYKQQQQSCNSGNNRIKS